MDIPAIEYPPLPVVENNLISEVVHFPVSDADVGSISYGKYFFFFFFIFFFTNPQNYKNFIKIIN